MRTHLNIVLTALLAASFLPASVDAQLFDVNRNSIDLPFLRLQRRQRPRTRVQPPDTGTQVESGRNHPDPHSQQNQLLPTPAATQPLEPVSASAGATDWAADVAAMDWLTLRQVIRAGESDLDRQLGRYGAAEIWRRQLEIPTLNRLLAVDLDAPPSSALRAQLQPVLAAYDDVAVSPTGRPVTRLNDFQMVRAALREFLTSPRERQRGRLIVTAAELDTALGQIPGGAAWIQRLRLPNSIYGVSELSTEQVALVDESAASEADQLQPLLEQFEAISRNPGLREIASRPEFHATMHHLAEYVALIDGPQPADDELVPTISREYLIRQKSD